MRLKPLATVADLIADAHASLCEHPDPFWNHKAIAFCPCACAEAYREISARIPRECSICRGHHGLEIEHPCE